MAAFDTLYLIEILHQTTTQRQTAYPNYCCILSKFYIKPQLLPFVTQNLIVVSYRNSTSNHNSSIRYDTQISVVSYRNSTSNHNSCPRTSSYEALYLIEILHQTTTVYVCFIGFFLLYLIEILHQTTTHRPRKSRSRTLYLIEILHQTTTYQ